MNTGAHRGLGWTMILVGMGVGLCSFTAFAGASAKAKRVLVVHSFGSAAPPFTTGSTAFETALAEEMGGRVDLDEVSLDVARYATLDMEEALVELMRKRQAKWQPDLVVPIGSPSGIFVAQYRDRLFSSQTPVIYSAMDQRRLPPGALQTNATFVGASYDLAGAVQDILQLAPATTNIVVVIGASPLEQFWTDALHKEFEPFTNRVGFTWFNDLPFDQVLQRSAKLPPHSFILLILLIRDAAGVTHNADEALRQIHEVANAPVNGLFRNQLGMGIVGGRLYADDLEGRESARVAASILRGESTANFPPKVLPPSLPQYDSRELQRWGISVNRLPAESTILFGEPSVWERYKWRIVAGASLVAAQAALIFVLLANFIRRRRAESSLAETETRFRATADTAPMMMWMSGTDKLCTFVNKPWLDFTGRKLEQELGRGWAEGIQREDLQRCLKTYGEAFDARIPFVMEYRLRRHNGEYRWISDAGRPRYDEQGNFLGYIGSCVDITDSRRKTEALVENENRLRAVLDTAEEGIITINGRGIIESVNAAAEKIFGYRDSELIGQNVQKIVPPEFDAETDSHFSHYWLSHRAKMANSHDTNGRRKDGSEFPLELSVSEVMLADRKVFTGFVRDVSERRQSETELRELRRSLAHAGRVSLLGQLSSAMAHELSQPLAAVLRNAEAAEMLLQDPSPDLEELRAIVHDIRKDDERAGNVIDRLRSLLKRRDLDLERLELDSVIYEVVSLVRGDAATRHVQIDVSNIDNLPNVKGDRIHLQQVLLNLLLNAMDALSGLPPGTARIRIQLGPVFADRVQVSVSDNGPGFAKGTHGKLFEPFFTTKEHGMGMGLPICKAIIEAHRGKIWAENGLHGGAVFHFTVAVFQMEEVS